MLKRFALVLHSLGLLATLLGIIIWILSEVGDGFYVSVQEAMGIMALTFLSLPTTSAIRYMITGQWAWFPWTKTN